MEIQKTIIVLGVLGIAVALFAGYLLCRMHFVTRAFKAISRDAEKQTKVFKNMLTVMAKDGIDVKSYLNKAAETIEDK